MPFQYLIAKINDAPLSKEPFAHIRIEDFFNADDFAQIIHSQEITTPPANDDTHLFHILSAAGYQIIDFPGCITNPHAYMEWHKEKPVDRRIHNACEGFGVTLRLKKTHSTIIKELRDFLASAEWNNCLADKFNINIAATIIDNGIQKYLDGYEISPHPDIRKKALTYMVNINPNQQAELSDHHTHYLQFTAQYSYVQKFWEHNKDIDRSWVPWHWCNSIYQQKHNNSIVIFAPDNNTLHGIKANYNHLHYQRTQLYGNLWYKHSTTRGGAHWKNLDLRATDK